MLLMLLVCEGHSTFAKGGRENNINFEGMGSICLSLSLLIPI